MNSLTPTEKAAGWQLLFDGTDFTGWHNFKKPGVLPGWQVPNGCQVGLIPQHQDPATAERRVITG